MMTELGRRAAASKNWRWMPGMLSVHVDEDGEHYPYRCRRHWRGHVAIGQCTDGRPEDNAEFCLPDLDDPATLGCLLALVREAWGDLGASVWHDRRSGVWSWMADGCIHGVFRPSDADGYDTEAEALVAALEAAP